MERIETEVAVVGAGLAGLSAARALAAEGVSFEVIEARDRVGGRTVNESIGDGKIAELGGQWVGPTQDRILALIPELGLETFPTFGTGLNLIERKGKVRSYKGTIPKANPVALAELGVAIAAARREWAALAVAMIDVAGRRSAFPTADPHRPALYPTWLSSSPIAASLSASASFPLCIIPFALRVSIPMASGLSSAVLPRPTIPALASCNAVDRKSATRLCRRPMAAMLRRRRLLPRSPFSGFGLRSSSRCRCASLRCAARSALTFSYSRPSETVARVLIPASTPTG